MYLVSYLAYVFAPRDLSRLCAITGEHSNENQVWCGNDRGIHVLGQSWDQSTTGMVAPGNIARSRETGYRVSSSDLVFLGLFLLVRSTYMYLM